MPKFAFLVRASIALALSGRDAQCQGRRPPACAERTKVIQKLEERFGETLRSLGLHQGDGVVEIYSSETTGTWTILMTRPDGISCLLAAGQLWEQDVKPISKPGQDA